MQGESRVGLVGFVLWGTVSALIGMAALVMTRAYLDAEVVVVTGPLLALIAFVLAFHLFFLAAVPFALFGFRRWPFFAATVFLAWTGYGFAGVLLRA